MCAQLQSFVQRYFGEAGSDLEEWQPDDMKEHFALLDRITNANYR